MAALLSALPILVAVLANTALSLEFHFYRNSCRQAEMVGCDASVLLDSKGENVAEKEAFPNLSLRGFEVIDEIKMELEKQCRGVVSCADILALATRDGVALSGGSSYHIPTGRRDGTISTIGDVQLPGPSFSIDAALSAFKVINLDLDDLTTLLGAHSIGFCHCGFFVDRLYNFEGTGLPDPDLDPGLLDSLQKKCPIPINQIFNISIDPTVFMTPMTKTPFNLDSSFYRGVLDGKAILQLDQELAFTDVTRTLALTYINKPNVFRQKFSKAMIKLGNVNVLTGQQGEIRLNCRRINNGSH
ncbi:hypothetical protein HHK36_005577 [Tetracentron sinense]|uniref:Peroxidase n=1 Tax=Tetracentron sinense TaxID=13715 RepID=A0A835DMY9_TETSI|nr:hypothetical protein HHK36_005577 [Tetracentron sinense]